MGKIIKATANTRSLGASLKNKVSTKGFSQLSLREIKSDELKRDRISVHNYVI